MPVRRWGSGRGRGRSPVEEFRQVPDVEAEVAADGGRLGRLKVLFRGCPFEGEMDDLTGAGKRFHGMQGGAKDLALGGGVSGRSKGCAEGVLDSSNSRGSSGQGEFGNHGEGDGGEAGGLDFTLNQSDGPAADGSNGDEHNDVHMLLTKPADDLRDGFAQEGLRAEGVSDVGVVSRGDGGDFAGGG